MDLWAIRKNFEETIDDHWNLLEVSTYFHDRIVGSGDEMEVESHYHRAVLTSDVRLALEWGMHANSREDDVQFKNYPWGEQVHWPDPKVVEEFIDVFWDGSLVDRLRVMSVDGYRALLPLPKKRGDDWTVMGWEVDLTRLVDQISGHDEFHRYFEGTGFATIR